VNITRTLFRLLLGTRDPVVEGELDVEGLRAPLVVRRDGHGIPHVDASSDDDASFALGFLQAQDRTFQLEILLRTVRGTLAELLGPRALPVDRLARRLGFRRGAETQLEACAPDIRRWIEAFCRGIAAAHAHGLPRRPHGHALLRLDPTGWEPGDAIAIHRLVSFVLPANWDTELVRLRMLLDDGPEAVRDLAGTYPDWLPLQATGAEPLRAVLDAVQEDLEGLAAAVGLGGASNAWALSGDRTASGRPLLANDPHLAPQLPPHWYLAHVRTPEWEAAGANFVGMPAFLSAHNGHGAWGVTAGLVDNTDFSLEWVDGERAWRAGSWEPCRRWTETIRVRGGAEVEEEVVETPRGPLVGPALRGTGVDAARPGEARPTLPAGGRLGLALRATWLEPRPLVGFLRAHRARSFDELRELFRDWPTVSLSVAWAGADERIGWQLTGEAPVRRGTMGTMPWPGWDPRRGWEEERVPLESMPRRQDPGTGFVVTANNKPTEDAPGAPWLGADWIDGYRAERIQEVLAERSDWDVSTCLALQRDVVSVPWREIREDVLELAGKALAERAGDSDTGGSLAGGGPTAGGSPPDVRASDLRFGLELLREWDGRLSPDSAAATVYELLSADLITRIVRSRAPRASAWALGRGFHLLTPRSFFARKGNAMLSGLLSSREEGWLAASWPEAVGRGLAAAVGRLRQEVGEDAAAWAWGRVRPLVLHHPLGQLGPLGRVYDRGPLRLGGDSHTVAQMAALPDDPLAPPSAIPSLRMAVPIGDPEGARFALPGGQSENPLSPHYDDLLGPWSDGTGVPIPWSETEVRRAAVAELRLAPTASPRREPGDEPVAVEPRSPRAGGPES